MRKPPPKSILNLSAQCATLYALRSVQLPDNINTVTNIDLPHNLAPLDRAVIRLMEFNGLRISEVLNIKSYDIAANGTIKIHALKGSNNRLIQYNSEWSYIVEHRLMLPLSSQNLTRFYYYRLFKKLGIYAKIGARQNNSVTHYFRHKIAADLRASDFETSDISQQLGHKKQSNSAIYGH